MIKSEFYKPLQIFVKTIENNHLPHPRQGKVIISEFELKMLTIISKAKQAASYRPSLDLLEIFQGKEFLLNDAFKIHSQYFYPKQTFNFKTYLDEFMKINNLKYKKFLWLKIAPNFIKESCAVAIKIFDKFGNSFNNILKLIDLTNITTVRELLTCSQDAPNKLDKFNVENDEKFLIGKLSQLIMTKIEDWKINDATKWNEYKKFASAVRAARRLPFNFMNDHINMIKDLFPVIITTPETNFINWKKEYFDYAILDESSQIFLEMGLPILYLAKIKVLAGDSKQMQPSSWFLTRDTTDLETEMDVAENANSLLDYAVDKGVYEIMLNQNYRSAAAALMSFSAKKFYNSELDVIDNKIKFENEPITVLNVAGKWETGVNYEEATTVIMLANDMIDNVASLIILAFNVNQKQLIEQKILESHPKLYKAIEEEKLAIRNIENIQGDEADVIIMSLVYDATTNIASTYVARKGGKNALNVAISRAKNKMIVVKSITAQTVKTANSEDFAVFREWLEFLDMDLKDQKKYSITSNHKIVETFGEVDSKFEREVIDFIKENIKASQKLKLIKQYEVGSYAIDIALVDDANIFVLGIEVDGYKYHEGQGFDKYLSDCSRQEFLEAKGYNIYRIKELDFKINKMKIISDLKMILN